MVVKEISIEQIEVSEFNTRKDLADGQQDSTTEDLARSIERQGLLSPITVFQKQLGWGNWKTPCLIFAALTEQQRKRPRKHLHWPCPSGAHAAKGDG